MRKTILPMLAAGVLLFAACGSDPSSGNSESIDSSDLDGRDFVSTGIQGQDLVEGTEIRLTFSDGSLGADAGCNSMGGDYVLEEGILVVGPMFATEMGCEPALMEQDTWLAEFLTASPAASLDGDILILDSATGTTIDMLDRESADPDQPIEGTLWVVDGIVIDDVVSSVPGGATASLTIEDGTAAVETGCNTAGGSVEVGDDTLTFGGMMTTLMACPPAETELERAVLAVLDGEVSYEIEANRLSIRRTTPDGVVGLDLKSDT